MISAVIIFPRSHVFATNQKTDTSGRHIVIFNAFDPSDSKSRKNKKELFTELADSLKEYLNYFLAGKNDTKTTIIPELLKDISVNNIQAIMAQTEATMVIVIMNLNIYFEETNVAVTKNYDGSKSREASYDICCLVSYNIYQPGVSIIPAEERNCEFFTTRSVASGLPAGGPDIAGKKKYTYAMVRKNAFKFLSHNAYLFE